MSRELVAEAVEQGLPVEEGVGAPYRRPLRRRPPAQDPDQRSLVRSPSCINQWKRGRRVSFATQQRKETDKIKMVMGSWLGCEMQCIALERLPQALGVLGGRRRRARHGDSGHGCRSPAMAVKRCAAGVQGGIGFIVATLIKRNRNKTEVERS